jgi:antitoxin component of MazEF toxin-antitoxin module
MAQKVIKTGNSLAVTVPAWFCKDLGIRVGDLVKVKLDPGSGKVIYMFEGAKQLPLSENFFRRQHKIK